VITHSHAPGEHMQRHAPIKIIRKQVTPPAYGYIAQTLERLTAGQQVPGANPVVDAQSPARHPFALNAVCWRRAEEICECEYKAKHLLSCKSGFSIVAPWPDGRGVGPLIRRLFQSRCFFYKVRAQAASKFECDGDCSVLEFPCTQIAEPSGHKSAPLEARTPFH